MAKITRPYKNFEEAIIELENKSKEGPVSLKTLLTITAGKGKIFLVVFLSLIFGQIPGIALLFGMLIAYVGIRMILNGSHIWIPKKLLHKKVPAKIIKKGTKQVLKIMKLIKRWTHARYPSFVHPPRARYINGTMIALIGIFMCLSPPVPLVGYLSMAALFFLGVGLINEDGIYVAIGYGCTLAYVATVSVLLKYVSLNEIIDFSKRLMHIS